MLNLDDPADDPIPSSRSAAPAPTRHVAVLGHFAMGPTYSVLRPGGASSWLLTWTIAGSGRLSHRSAVVEAGRHDLVVLGPDVPQRYGTSGPSWDFWWSHFQPRPAWMSIIQPWGEGEQLFHVNVRDLRDANRIDAAFLRAFGDVAPDGAPRTEQDIYVSPVATTDLVLNAVEEILLVAARSIRPTPSVGEPDGIAAAVRAITVNPAASHTVASLASIAAISPSHFAHEFKRRTGRSPMQAVVAARLDLATNLLRSTSLQVGQVAGAVGFADPYYFSRVFRRHIGVTPSRYAARRSADGGHE